MNKPRKHASLIKAWAEGAEIQVRCGGEWIDCNEHMSWSKSCNYRIKPEKEYTKSSLTDADLERIFGSGYGYESSLRAVADEAVKRYIMENDK